MWARPRAPPPPKANPTFNFSIATTSNSNPYLLGHLIPAVVYPAKIELYYLISTPKTSFICFKAKLWVS
ncbi:hypothetical protein ES705_31195 [subsurface metagenome]